MLGSLSFNGQRCTALKILIVHRSLAERFVARFVEEVKKLKAGMPWEPGVTITPLPELGKVDYMAKMVEDATGKGARVVNPGGGEHVGTMTRGGNGVDRFYAAISCAGGRNDAGHAGDPGRLGLARGKR